MLLEGKKVFVGPFLRRSERSSDSETKYTNVFVKNLDEGELPGLFETAISRCLKGWGCCLRGAVRVQTLGGGGCAGAPFE